MRIKWEDGVSIEYKKTKIFLDPQHRRVNCQTALVTHAHADHSNAFRVNNVSKFSSEETMKLISTMGIRIERWHPLKIKERIVVGDIEVIPHASGHVLGSYEFEVVTPEVTALFTGDLNTKCARTVKPAEPVQCDVLIIESTFGSPNFVFPPDNSIAENMVKWAGEVLKSKRIPVFQTDPLGNAQEIIRIFNENTNIPIVSHQKISRINKIYEEYGHKMRYIDKGSEEAHEFISRRNAILINPKYSDLPTRPDFASALVSGWALSLKCKSFPLSDHADFPSLMSFINECRPKLVLTHHGGNFNDVLAKQIEKKLKIRAYPINLIPANILSR